MSEDAAAATAYQAVRKMFEDADTNGDSLLDASELATLMATMQLQVWVARKGNAVAMAPDSTEAILAQMEMLDTTKQGGLNFAQFCQLLGMPPWNALVAEEISALLRSVSGEEEAVLSPKTRAIKTRRASICEGLSEDSALAGFLAEIAQLPNDVVRAGLLGGTLAGKVDQVATMSDAEVLCCISVTAGDVWCTGS